MLYRLIMWKRRWFGMAPVPRYIHTVITAEQCDRLHDSLLIEPPFEGAAPVGMRYEGVRDLYHCIWVIR